MKVLFDPPASRRRPFLMLRRPAGLVLVLVLAAGCASEQTVATDLQLSRVVTGQGVELQVDAAARDALALRGASESSADASGPVGGVAPAGPGTDAETDSAQTTAAQTTAAQTTAVPSNLSPASAAPSTLAATLTTVPAASPPTLASPTVVPASPPPVPADGDGSVAVAAPAPSSTTRPAGAQPPVGAGPTVVPAAGTPAPVTSPAATAPATPPGTEAAEALAGGETRSLTLLAELRSGLGLEPLVRDPELDAFARDWSRHMAESGVFDHSTSPFGENIAFTSNTGLTASEAADVFQRLWVESDVHYQNMTGAYVKVGIGLYRTDRGWYGTHAFSY